MIKRTLDKQSTKEQEANVNLRIAGLFILIISLFVLLFKERSLLIVSQIVISLILLISSIFLNSKSAKFRLPSISTYLSYLFSLNIIGLITAEFSKSIAILYFVIYLTFMLIYFCINIAHVPSKAKEILKLLVSLAIILLGGFLPVLI